MAIKAMAYCEGVISGEIVACKLIVQACQRHVDDLEHGHERGLWFDEVAATTWIVFFETFLRHSKGDLAGQTVRLEGWQQFHLWVLFGWKREDGTRRFRESYLEVARKNGKTLMMAGVGIGLMLIDGETGAEIYSLGTKRDQAKLSHTDAVRMVEQDPYLRSMITLHRDNIHVPSTYSKYVPLSADSKTMDGLNTHGGLIDEVHAHRDRGVYDKVKTSMSARSQPLLYLITTAGDDPTSLCYELHEHGRAVLSGSIIDDSFFCMIFTLDKGDRWDIESNWYKSNPNLNISKRISVMRDQAAMARSIPSALAAFKQLELNIWVQAANQWLDPAVWSACNRLPPGFGKRPKSFKKYWQKVLKYFEGMPCWAGLDLSSNTDTTALVLVFRLEEDGRDVYYFLPWVWLPADNIASRRDRDRVPYDLWADWGILTLNPGNVIDTRFILWKIGKLAEQYDIRSLAFDRWGAAAIQTKLMEMGPDEDWLIQFGQGSRGMSPPMKSLEQMVLQGTISHLDNPIIKWMGGNVEAVRNHAGDIKPDKRQVHRRIDGMVAGVMGLDRALRDVDDGFGDYDEIRLI